MCQSQECECCTCAEMKCQTSKKGNHRIVDAIATTTAVYKANDRTNNWANSNAKLKMKAKPRMKSQTQAIWMTDSWTDGGCAWVDHIYADIHIYECIDRWAAAKMGDGSAVTDRPPGVHVWRREGKWIAIWQLNFRCIQSNSRVEYVLRQESSALKFNISK